MAYGIEIYDTDGTTKVLSPDTRYITRVSDVVTYSFAASGSEGDSYLLETDMTDLTTANSDVVFPIAAGNLFLGVVRESNGFRIGNGVDAPTDPITFYAIRF